jgi:hypothetical protein
VLSAAGVVGRKNYDVRKTSMASHHRLIAFDAQLRLRYMTLTEMALYPMGNYS